MTKGDARYDKIAESTLRFWNMPPSAQREGPIAKTLKQALSLLQSFNGRDEVSKRNRVWKNRSVALRKKGDNEYYSASISSMVRPVYFETTAGSILSASIALAISRVR